MPIFRMQPLALTPSRSVLSAEADVSVARSEIKTERLKYQIDHEQQEASIIQIQKIQTVQARQEAEIARTQEASDQAKDQARILR